MEDINLFNIKRKNYTSPISKSIKHKRKPGYIAFSFLPAPAERKMRQRLQTNRLHQQQRPSVNHRWRSKSFRNDRFFPGDEYYKSLFATPVLNMDQLIKVFSLHQVFLLDQLPGESNTNKSYFYSLLTLWNSVQMFVNSKNIFNRHNHVFCILIVFLYWIRMFELI